MDTPLNSSVIESCGLISCELLRLDCDLLLVDTVNVSSRVRTITYRMYLCNVNNTPLRIHDVASH